MDSLQTAATQQADQQTPAVTQQSDNFYGVAFKLSIYAPKDDETNLSAKSNLTRFVLSRHNPGNYPCGYM